MSKHLLLLTFLLICNFCKASDLPLLKVNSGLQVEKIENDPEPDWKNLKDFYLNNKDNLNLKSVENKKLVACILTLTLGMLGVHRIYLGTKPWIPIVYLFTFGGGFFILPLFDLIAILSSKNIESFVNNPNVIMWLPKDDSEKE